MKQHRSSSLPRYYLKRILMAFFTWYLSVFLISIVINAQMEVTVRSRIWEQVRAAIEANTELKSAEAIAEFRVTTTRQIERSYGLHRPRFIRIGEQALKIIRLDLGNSRQLRTSWPKRSSLIKDILIENMKPTLVLFFTSTVLGAGTGILLGIHMAAKPGKRLDRAITMMTMLVVGTPVWWVCSILVYVFVFTFPIFKIGALHSTPLPDGVLLQLLDYVYYLALPLLAITMVKTWGFAFYTRNIVLGPLQEDYVTAARGRGLPESRILFRHAAASASPAIVTVTALGIVQALAGDILVEKVMSRPGLGSILWASLQWGDTAMLTGIFSIIAALYCFTLCALDLLYFSLDPRIRCP